MLLLFSGAISGQSVLDTAVVPIGKESMIIVAISDQEDPEMLKRYDYNAMFADIISHFYPADSTALDVSSTVHRMADPRLSFPTPEEGYRSASGPDRCPGNGRLLECDFKQLYRQQSVTSPISDRSHPSRYQAIPRSPARPQSAPPGTRDL